MRKLIRNGSFPQSVGGEKSKTEWGFLNVVKSSSLPFTSIPCQPNENVDHVFYVSKIPHFFQNPNPIHKNHTFLNILFRNK